MTKSLEYVSKRRPEWFSGTSEEVPSIEYFELILDGEREKIKDTKFGVIKSVIKFDENADFNYCNGWDLDMEKIFFQDEDEFISFLDVQIQQTAVETICENLHVPYENGEPLGGWPTNGDTIEYTIGNYIVAWKDDILKIALPVKYNLIPGIYHE